MGNQKRKTTIHGVEVKQVDFSGNWYTPVEERIRLALWADPAAVQGATAGKYRVLDHQIIPVGDRWAYTCTVEYPAGSGNTYPGSDFIDLKDSAGLAKAETSAVGRGLGLAGIAIEGGIASAEEMARMPSQPQQQPAQPAKPAKAPQAVNELASKPAPRDEQVDLAAKLREAGMGIKAVRQFTQDHIGRELDAVLLSKGRETLTMGETSRLLLELNKLANARQQQAAQQSA